MTIVTSDKQTARRPAAVLIVSRKDSGTNERMVLAAVIL